MSKFYKYFKILAYFVALGGCLYWQYKNHGSFPYLGVAFLFAAFIYLAAAIFGILAQFLSFLFSLIGTIGIISAIAWIADYITSLFPILSSDVMLWIFTIVLTVYMVVDIVWLSKYDKFERRMINGKDK